MVNYFAMIEHGLECVFSTYRKVSDGIGGVGEKALPGDDFNPIFFAFRFQIFDSLSASKKYNIQRNTFLKSRRPAVGVVMLL